MTQGVFCKKELDMNKFIQFIVVVVMYSVVKWGVDDYLLEISQMISLCQGKFIIHDIINMVFGGIVTMVFVSK
jgi:hypothetical protein